MIALDLSYISWTLQTSPDVPARLSALNCLATMPPARFDATLVIGCFDTLTGCVRVTNGEVAVIEGLEQLAMLSALCYLRTVSHLTDTDTIVNDKDVRQQYTRAFPSEMKFDGLLFSHTLGAIHSVFSKPRKFRVGIPTSMVPMTLITW